MGIEIHKQMLLPHLSIAVLLLTQQKENIQKMGKLQNRRIKMEDQGRKNIKTGYRKYRKSLKQCSAY